ncbi:MAG: hypothetical protein EPN88_01510 [Bacteroidetes bacterium]|nr:MAG: hypothetical protein EPN88_01510 [Bacteroidota bacterium]
MKTIMKFMTAALIMVFAVSCSKNNDTGFSLTFKGTTTLPIIKKGENATGFTFTEALLGIKKIEIKREDEMLNNGDTEYDFKGNYVVDLLTGTSTPSLGFAQFLPGTYNKFESETAKILNGGKSLSVKGTFTNTGGIVYGFEFSTTAEIEFEFESDSGFVLNEGTVFDMLINVNLPLLFQGVDFSKATANGNGIIIIDETSNTPILSAIKNNLDHAADMEDEHESGKL